MTLRAVDVERPGVAEAEFARIGPWRRAAPDSMQLASTDPSEADSTRLAHVPKTSGHAVYTLPTLLPRGAIEG